MGLSEDKHYETDLGKHFVERHSTSTHGGYRVSEIAFRSLQPEMQRLVIEIGPPDVIYEFGAYWFEEDCAFLIPHIWLKGNVNDSLIDDVKDTYPQLTPYLPSHR
jgi:hypothetical protein